MDYLTQDLEVMRSEGVLKIEVEKKEPLRNEIEEFLRCVIENKKPLPSGEDGKYVLEVAISAIRSYKEGRMIDLREMTLQHFAYLLISTTFATFKSSFGWILRRWSSSPPPP